MKNEVLLSQLIEKIELEILSTEESALIGGSSGPVTSGNNCKCNGNNCNCELGGNNCQCNGNNCSCAVIVEPIPEPIPMPGPGTGTIQ